MVERKNGYSRVRFLFRAVRKGFSLNSHVEVEACGRGSDRVDAMDDAAQRSLLLWVRPELT